VVVPPVNEITPYINQVNVLLERLTVESIRRAQQPVPVMTPRPPPMAVPAPVCVPISKPSATPPRAASRPVTPSKQRTIPQYFVKKGPLGGPREREQTPPGIFHWPEEHDFTSTDTPPNEAATPRAQSPETVGEGSVDNEDTEPTWPLGATTDILAKINMYRLAGVGDLERRQQYTMNAEQTTRECAARNEGCPDNREASGQARDDPRPREGTAEFDWRVELRDHSLRYDSLTGPATLKQRGWPDGDRAVKQRECTPWRGQMDSPISHLNLWDGEMTGDPHGGAYDSGGTPRGDKASSMYDGGGDSTPVPFL